MTVIASNIQVGAVYFEIGLCVVVKQPQVPSDRVMAGLAVVRELACVRIVLKVATDALRIGFSKHLGFVARLALEIAMLSQERESRQVMIEQRRVLPGRLGVAIAASVTLLSGMGFVIEMAGGTGRAG